MRKIIKKISETPGCVLWPSSGLPKVSESHVIPDDVKAFYDLCGGAILFEGEDYSWRILPPEEFRLAINDFDEIDTDKLDGFYFFADDFNGDYLAINFGHKNNGLVVDGFHETFGNEGDTPVIALSFGEIINRLLENRGGYPFWLNDKATIYRDWYE